jgi:hypothetical protein
VTLYRLYRDVLGADTNASILELAVGLQPHFEHSRVAPRRIEPRTRASTVVYDDRLTEVAPLVRANVEARLGDALAELEIDEFEPTGFEIQLTSHNDGEFFRRHTDSCTYATAGRTVAFVYYLHREPKAFSGGEVVFFGPDGQTELVDPPNDSMLIFDPRTPHEVRPVRCPARRFGNGRFTVNGWVHRRRTASRSGFVFDQRIFSPVGGWAPPAPRSAVPAHPVHRHRSPSPRPVPGPAADAAVRLLELYGELSRRHSEPAAIDVRPDLSGREFFDEFYSRNRPVLIPGLLAGSEAVAKWSPEYLSERYGSAAVEITDGREADPDYEVRYRSTVRTTTMAEFVRRLTSADVSNDFYLVARNNLFDRHPFHALRDQLRPPADIIDRSDRRRGAMKMWFGPKGTVTPLHFDEHSILFAQVYGRKQFKLIPAFDHSRLYPRHRYYSEIDPTDVNEARHPLFAGATVIDLEVGPGDALFLPAAWWHWARSLSVSISVTFSNFVGGNVALARAEG